MKTRNPHELVNQRLSKLLLLSFFLLIGFSNIVFAQGWGFTFQLSQSGPCGANIPGLPTFTVPNAIPTQGQCEALRQNILSIKASYPQYDSRGKYLGDCKVFYTCTPCTGSDIVVAGQSGPAEVSLAGQYLGKPLYSPHESSAFEDWAKEYRQQLESYGVTSILGNSLTTRNIPLTGNKDFDDFYSSQTANFNPTTPASSKPAAQDANVVYLNENAGKVQLLTTQAEQAQRDKWYEEKGFNNLAPITDAEGVSESLPAERSWKETALRTALGEADGLAGVIANFEMNVTDETFKGLNQAVGYVVSGNDAKAMELGNNLLNGQVVYNSVKKTALDAVSDKLTEVGYVPLLKSVKGAEDVYKVSKIGVSLYENKHPDE